MDVSDFYHIHFRFVLTKLVQGEWNGKKNLFLLTCPSRRLTCAVRRKLVQMRVEWQEKLVFIDIPEPPPNLLGDSISRPLMNRLGLL